jgi:hypothetical protein
VDERVRRRHLDQLAAELRRRLIERRRTEAAAGRSSPNLPDAVRHLVDEDAAVLEPATRARLCELILREAIGLGPLEELIGDPAVEEVMVNGHERIYVERRGRIERADVRFESEQALRDAIERILTPLGRRVAQPHGRRAARGWLPRTRSHPASGGRRANDVDPALLGSEARPARAGGARDDHQRAP